MIQAAVNMDTLEFMIEMASLQQSILEAPTMASVMAAMNMVSVSDVLNSGGDITVSMLNLDPTSVYFNFFSEFARDYTGTDTNVTQFCANVRARDFNNAVLCEAGHINDQYVTRNSVMPALREHWATRGNPFIQ